MSIEDRDKSSIESLTEKLYSRRSEEMAGLREHTLLEETPPVSEHWQGEEPSSSLPKRRIPFLQPVLIGSFVFLFLIVSYGAYLFFDDSNRVSSGNVEVAVSGPVSIRGGETLPLVVSVRNNNAIPLELADLIVEYPKGTRLASDPTKELPRYREGLGTIKPNEEVTRPVSALLFGAEGVIETVKVTVEYRLPGSNAIFYKETDYQFSISSSPLSIVVDSPAELNSGQEIAFKISVSSNAEKILNDIVLKSEYPSGFSFKSAEPSAFADTAVWRLGDIKPGSSRTVTVRGTLSGEEGDQRFFRFEVGQASADSDKDISVPFATLEKLVTVNKPFIGLRLVIDGKETSESVVQSGKNIRIDIPYVNNLPETVADVEISLVLSGSALNRQSVLPDRGFYRSVDNTVIWNESTDGALAAVAPGDGGTVSLTLAPQSASTLSSVKNPQMSLSVSVSGKHSLSGRVPETVTSQVSGKVKVESDLQFSSRLLHYSGPIVNTGPMPPKAEKETTYTVTWAVGTGSNDITDAKISASLPTYVRFVVSVTPSSEKVAFSQSGSTVLWDVGALSAGVGFDTAPREVSFQIAFTPSVSQVGTSPTLVREATFSATDRFTGTKLSESRAALSTRLSTDSRAKTGDDIVVQ